MVIAAVPCAAGHVNLLRGQGIVTVPISQLVIGIGFHSGPRGNARETLERGEIAGGEIARVSVSAATGESGRVAGTDPKTVGVIAQDFADEDSSRAPEAVSRPAVFRRNKAEGDVQVTIRGTICSAGPEQVTSQFISPRESRFALTKFNKP